MKVLLFLAFFTNEVGNAPWCVQNDYVKQCFYYSLSSCQNAAGDLNGICVPK